MISVALGDFSGSFETDGALFSPRGADEGTVALLKSVELTPGQRVLDLGCGWGLAGAYAASKCGAENVVMLDVDERAVEIARANAARNGFGAARCLVSDAFESLDEAGFDWILTNPPYHTDFAVAKRFIEKGFNRLKIGGRLALVVKRREWYYNKLKAIFGGARVAEVNGYFVMIAEKRGPSYAKGARRERP